MRPLLSFTLFVVFLDLLYPVLCLKRGCLNLLYPALCLKTWGCLYCLILSLYAGLEGENEQGEFKLLVDMKRLYAFYQAHDITDLADIERDVSSIITKGMLPW